MESHGAHRSVECDELRGSRGPLGEADVPDARAALPHAQGQLLRVLQELNGESEELRNELLGEENMHS